MPFIPPPESVAGLGGRRWPLLNRDEGNESMLVPGEGGEEVREGVEGHTPNGRGEAALGTVEVVCAGEGSGKTSSAVVIGGRLGIIMLEGTRDQAAPSNMSSVVGTCWDDDNCVGAIKGNPDRSAPGLGRSLELSKTGLCR
jgi:hypothetical protein